MEQFISITEPIHDIVVSVGVCVCVFMIAKMMKEIGTIKSKIGKGGYEPC